MAKFIIALDQGTTSSRAVLFDEKGSIKGIAQQEFQQIFPNPGWVEHNPDEIWSTQLGVLQKVIVENGIELNTIVAVGITNQEQMTSFTYTRTLRHRENSYELHVSYLPGNDNVVQVAATGL